MRTLEIKIDASEITDWKTFHKVFKRELGFPDFYGENMDAWIDCMTYVDYPDDSMTKIKVSPDEILVLEIIGVGSLKERCPSQHDALVDGCGFVNFRRVEAGERPLLALSLVT
jgi:Barstar (barnase inhibitor)